MTSWFLCDAPELDGLSRSEECILESWTDREDTSFRIRGDRRMSECLSFSVAVCLIQEILKSTCFNLPLSIGNAI